MRRRRRRASTDTDTKGCLRPSLPYSPPNVTTAAAAFVGALSVVLYTITGPAVVNAVAVSVMAAAAVVVVAVVVVFFPCSSWGRRRRLCRGVG